MLRVLHTTTPTSTFNTALAHMAHLTSYGAPPGPVPGSLPFGWAAPGGQISAYPGTTTYPSAAPSPAPVVAPSVYGPGPSYATPGPLGATAPHGVNGTTYEGTGFAAPRIHPVQPSPLVTPIIVQPWLPVHLSTASLPVPPIKPLAPLLHPSPALPLGTPAVTPTGPTGPAAVPLVLPAGQLPPAAPVLAMVPVTPLANPGWATGLAQPVEIPGNGSPPPRVLPRTLITNGEPTGPTPPPPVPGPGQLTRVSEIGHGSYSQVYSARSPGGTVCALKRSFKEDITSGMSAVREADMLYRSRGHPYIVSVSKFVYGQPFASQSSPLRGKIRVGQIDDGIHFAFPLAEGSLHNHIHTMTYANGAEYYRASLRYFVNILLGVEHLHHLGIIHRDLKPGNVLIANGSAQVCDFGLARFHTTQEPPTPQIGTWMYRAPEIVLALPGVPVHPSGAALKLPEMISTPYSDKVDVWSLGYILFELLARRPLWYTENDTPDSILSHILKHLPQRPPRAAYVRPTVVVNGTELKPLEINFDMIMQPPRSYVEQLNLTTAQVRDLQCDGRLSQTRLVDLMSGMLQFEAKHRLSVTQALDHPALDAFRELIHTTRAEALAQAAAKHGRTNTGMREDSPSRSETDSGSDGSAPLSWRSSLSGLSANAGSSALAIRPGANHSSSSLGAAGTSNPVSTTGENSRYSSLTNGFGSPPASQYGSPARDTIPLRPFRAEAYIQFVACVERTFVAEAVAAILKVGRGYRWYNKRVLFHSLSYFDRYLVYKFASTTIKPTSLESRDRGHLHTRREVGLYFYVCLYLACKFFATSRFPSFAEFAAPHFTRPEDIAVAEQFEGGLCQHVFDWTIYQETILESLDRFRHVTSDDDVLRLSHMYLHEERLNGMTTAQGAQFYLRQTYGYCAAPQ